MIKLVAWLMEIEQLAHVVYKKAERYFQREEPLRQLLSRMADDEVWHAQVMDCAMRWCRDDSLPEKKKIAQLAIDPVTDRRIREAFQATLDDLKAGSLNQDRFLERMIFAETSEWNDMFLYVVNTLKTEIQEFRTAPIRFQEHKRILEQTLLQMPRTAHLVTSIKNLPEVWRESILIIEDDSTIAQLLVAVFNCEGDIDVAPDGQKGLKYIQDKYYKLILSDVDMPKMSGIDCFRNALEQFPEIGKRYLFFTGDISPETKRFFKENRLPYLRKPSYVTDIRKAALEILLASTDVPMACSGLP